MASRSLVVPALALLVLIWGSTWAAIRISLEGIPPLTGVALRFALAGLVLLALVPVFRVGLRPERRVVALWGLNTVFSFTLSYGIVYWAEQYVPSGLTAVLWATFPLWVALLAHLWLPGERLSLRSVAGILAGFGGVAVIFSEDLSKLAAVPRGSAGPPVALAAAVLLLSPLSAAIANVAVKRWGRGVHPLSLTALPMLFTGALVGVAAAKIEGFADLHLTPRPVAAWLYLSIVGSAVTFTVYYWLLSRLPATQLSLMTFAIPVVAVFLGSLALDEPVTARVLAGSALVVLGVAVAARATPAPAATGHET